MKLHYTTRRNCGCVSDQIFNVLYVGSIREVKPSTAHHLANFMPTVKRGGVSMGRSSSVGTWKPVRLEGKIDGARLILLFSVFTLVKTTTGSSLVSALVKIAPVCVFGRIP